MREDDLNLYVLAELGYNKKHLDSKNIFPFGWYSTKNYKLKVEIIAEALKKNILIKDTELYQKYMIEGIK